MAYKAHPVEQLDGSQYQGFNCVAADDAMFLDRATQGAIRTSGAHIRSVTGDTSGGLTLDQIRYVNRVFFSVDGDQHNKMSWADFKTELKHRGAVLLIRYAPLVGTAHDCFRGNFSGNHGLYISEELAGGGFSYVDSGADGRYPGCPNGYQTITEALLRKCAAQLITGFSGPALGDGFAQALFGPPDPTTPVAQWQASVHPTPPSHKTSFWQYTVKNGAITGRISRNTGGFSAACTQPVRYRWSSAKTTRVLVQLTSGSRKGQFIEKRYAKEI